MQHLRKFHGDGRTNNVILDSEVEARGTDYEYGKLMPDNIENRANKITKDNNLGYLSPECIESRK